MWTRAELKERAKKGLKIYYWYGLIVCFIATLLGAGTGGSVGFNFGAGSSGASSQVRKMTEQADWEFVVGILCLFLAIAAVVFIISMIFKAFVSNMFVVGRVGFFTKSSQKQESAGIDELIYAFKSGHYLNIVKTMFFKGLFEFLWSLLFIIPGIIKSYEYYMIPYLMCEYPDMDAKEAFRLSKEMMKGEKWNTFVLELSFIGWYLLGLLACCIGGIFVNPYREATMAELYLELKKKVFQPTYEEPSDIEPSDNQFYDNHGQK